MGWNYLSIPKLQRCNRWSLGMDKLFRRRLYQACNYLSMLGLQLNHVSKRGHWVECDDHHNRGHVHMLTLSWSKISFSRRYWIIEPAACLLWSSFLSNYLLFCLIMCHVLQKNKPEQFWIFWWKDQSHSFEVCSWWLNGQHVYIGSSNGQRTW